MSKTVKIKKSELISEHKHLMGVLLNPTLEKLKREAKKQGKELDDLL